MLYPILSVIAVSLISLVGILSLSIKESFLKKYIFAFVSLAVGALLGDAFIHLIPEGFEQIGNPLYFSLAIIAGIVLFFMLEKFFHWHHHPDREDVHAVHPVGKMVMVSDGFHNFIDGLIIGASFQAGVGVGTATALAVILHEIPQEIGDFAVLLHAGYSKMRALWLNFLSALMALLGLFAFFLFGSLTESFSAWLIPFAAGGFIYIALSDLVPELHKEKVSLKYTIVQTVALVAGVLSMVALLFLE